MTFEISGKKNFLSHLFWLFYTIVHQFKFESLEFLKTFISENNLQHETSPGNSF